MSMSLRVEPTTLTWPVPPEIRTSPPSRCRAHAAKAREGANPHQFPTMGTSRAAEGYADPETEQGTAAGCVHRMRPEYARHHQAGLSVRTHARRNELLRDAVRVRRCWRRCSCRTRRSRRRCGWRRRRRDHGPTQRSNGRTTARAAGKCANVAERSAPSSHRCCHHARHRRRTRPRRCHPRWPRCPHPVCARTVAQHRRSPPQVGAKAARRAEPQGD
jgi:hypothetical protein